MSTSKKLLFLFFPLLLAFFSCQAKIDGVIREGGSANLSIKAALGPRTIALIRSLRFFTGEGDQKPILDGNTINHSLALAPGILSASLINTDAHSLEGPIAISNVGDFLTVGDDKSRFISFQESRDSSSIVIALDKNSAPELISMLSPEVGEYLSALMAPVMLGETMTKQEYLNLVTSIYGRLVSEEIASSRIRMAIELPKPVKTVLGGKFSKNLAEFDIPLLDILVMENPISYQITW